MFTLCKRYGAAESFPSQKVIGGKQFNCYPLIHSLYPLISQIKDSVEFLLFFHRLTDSALQRLLHISNFSSLRKIFFLRSKPGISYELASVKA